MLNQVVERDQHQVLICIAADLLGQHVRQIAERPTAIARLPHKRCACVQSPSQATLRVVDQQLVVNLFGDQTVGQWQRPAAQHRPQYIRIRPSLGRYAGALDAAQAIWSCEVITTKIVGEPRAQDPRELVRQGKASWAVPGPPTADAL